MNRPTTLIAATILAGGLAVTACSSAPLCTTGSCIASDAQKNLIGIVAKDEAVITKAVCDPATARVNAGGTFTVGCTVTESDGARWKGLASILPKQMKITFEPTQPVGG